jgi:prolyl oligopeptidase
MLVGQNAQVGVTEVLHGVPVHDRFRWLEDSDAPETRAWIDDRKLDLDQYLLEMEAMPPLRKRVLEFTDVETVDEVGMVNGRYFYRKRRPGEQQPKIYVSGAEMDSERLLVDPSKDGPYASANIHRVSPDGRLLAYQTRRGGEHARAIHIVDVDTGNIFPDCLATGLARGFTFSIANDGFYYCHDFIDHDSAEDGHHQIKFHRFGTAITEDALLLQCRRDVTSKLLLRADGEMLSALLSHDHKGILTSDFYTSDQNHHGHWRRVSSNVPAPFDPFFYRRRLFLLRIQQHSTGELVELDASTCAVLRVVVPQWTAPIRDVTVVADRLFVRYVVHTDTIIRIWTIEGIFLGLMPIEQGQTSYLLPRYSYEEGEFFVHSESFVSPPTVTRHSVESASKRVWHRQQAPVFAGDVQVHKVTYRSADGTPISMSLVGIRSQTPIKARPVLMTAYGGFGLTLTPHFSVFVSIMVELGFLFALPEIRGGSEEGLDWHEAARGRRRQTAFADFIAAAQWFFSTSITVPHRLAIFGGSNSGLLVGAVITQRPELFRAALCIAPILDMIRYHRFDRAHVWADEYGTSDNVDDFQALLTYSPYHHVRADVDYPSMLFVCGDKDTRCNPAHARKMVAQLISRSAQRRPILLDHTRERGHAPTMPLSVRVEAITLRIAFLCRELGVSPLGEVII